MSGRNRTSPLRSGFDYQDLWVLKFCGDWLNTPNSYEWITFETSPDEINSGLFYLDDILIRDTENKYELYQIKHRQNIADLWTWDDFLEKLPDAKQPLILKWYESFSRLELNDKIKIAAFITNGSPAPEVAAYLIQGKLDIDLLAQNFPDVFNKIRQLLFADEAAARKFFREFEFCFDGKNIYAFEQEVRAYFYRELRATKGGVDNLILQIQRGCRQPHPDRVTLNNIRQWCEFDEPRPLPEEFHIPEDFIIFDPECHEKILKDLHKPEGGIKVIYGTPGSGKSVYLSNLVKLLEKEQIIAIRHHYHISPDDPRPQERLIAERVIEAVKAQIKEHSELLDALANKNSQNVQLHEFIGQLATKLYSNNQRLIFIIDGLDHVLRYSDAKELEVFLRNICFPQPGLWIVLGMQLVAKQYLPQAVYDKCPENEWTEVRGLSKQDTAEIVKKNLARLHLPEHESTFADLLDALFSLTQGNPLHLRYTLQQLKNTIGGKPVTKFDCVDLLPYSGDIATYYTTLWRQLDNRAKTILLTIASVNFNFRKDQLFSCVSFFQYEPSDVSQSYNAIAHLIVENNRGRLAVYHNSFELFLKRQSEFEQQQIVLKQNIRRWLESTGFEDLKWAELRKIEYELGNKAPILAINKAWLVAAICHPRNPGQITSQMQLATQAAFESNNLAKMLELSYLHNYYLHTFEYVEEATDLIWEESLFHNPQSLNELDLTDIPTQALKVLANIADSCGDVESIHNIIQTLQERQLNKRHRNISPDTQTPKLYSAALRILPYNRQHNVKNVYKYIQQFSGVEWASNFVEVYSKSLLKLCQNYKVKELLNLQLPLKHKLEVIESCIKSDLENSSNDFLEAIKKTDISTPLCKIYLHLKGENIDSLPQLPSYEEFPLKISEFDSKVEHKWTELFSQYFLIGILYCFNNQSEKIKLWIENAPDHWPVMATGKLFEVAIKIAEKIKTKAKIEYSDLFIPFTTLKLLKWPDDRNQLAYQRSLKAFFVYVFKTLISLKKNFGDDLFITPDHLSSICSQEFFSKDDLIEVLLEIEEPLLSEEAYHQFLHERKENIKSSINYFPERSRDYAKLAKLSRIHDDHSNATNLLMLAANNLLGYGYHKDLYLSEVLDAIEVSLRANIEPNTIESWVRRIAPIIENIKKFTDGDETSHLPFELADILAKHNPELLYRNYYTKADDERLYTSERIFKSVITSLSLVDDTQKALATTALDAGSFKELKQRSNTDPIWETALTNIETYLGKINYPLEQESSYTPKDKGVPDYSPVSVGEIIHYLDKFETKWDTGKYLIGWANHWLEHGDRLEVYRTLKALIEIIGIRHISGELLDIAYPLAYEFDEVNAFEFLCHAQANDHGWHRYWTDKKKAEERWAYLKRKYSRRYNEFFKKSIFYSVDGIIQQSYFMPIVRGVEFFYLFNNKEAITTIIEASVAFAESLMGDTPLPTPSWFSDNYKDIDELDILIQRLVWPSPLVRERAASALGYLIACSAKKESIIARLLQWIQKQSMETLVAIALLPFIKAFEFTNNPLDHVNLNNIIAAIKVNSVVIEELISELARLKNTIVEDGVLPEYKPIQAVPESYVIANFFHECIKTFLAPVYHDRAVEIEEETYLPFVQQWSFTAEEIAKENNVTFKKEGLNFYGRNEHGSLLAGMSTKISEVYRSAFLRVLQYYYSLGHIPDDYYLDYAYATLPVDLSFWRISPNRAPAWWPQLSQVDNKLLDKSKFLQLDMKVPIDTLTEQEGDTILLAAEGAIRPAMGWEYEDPAYSFTLIGFGYEVVGAKLPTAEKIAEFINTPISALLPSKSDKPFNFLDGQGQYYSTNYKPTQLNDLIIYPLLSRTSTLSIKIWQYFRAYNSAWVANKNLAEGLSLKSDTNRWVYELGEERYLYFYDWLEGLKERYPADMFMPHGHYVQANKGWLESWLKSKHLRLGYVLKTTYKYKPDTLSKASSIDDYKLLKISSIIW